MIKNNVEFDSIVCVVRDEVAEVYSAPLCFANEEAGKRWFRNLADTSKKDYTLYKIADYCSKSSDIRLVDRVILIRGTD